MEQVAVKTKSNVNEKITKLVESARFEKFVIIIILLNAITLGLETHRGLAPNVHQFLQIIDNVFLAIFVAELFLKLFVYKNKYFYDAWRVFDFIIIIIACLPASGTFSVLRSLRVLRTLRMISTVPSLKRVVSGLLAAIPGLGAVGIIIAIIFYVGAVVATKLFGQQFPAWFGTIGESSYTLFQVMTLESWSMGIVRPVMEKFPFAWLFFLPFILVTTFTMLNLFIAVIVNAMQDQETFGGDQNVQFDGKDKIAAELESINQKIDRLMK